MKFAYTKEVESTFEMTIDELRFNLSDVGFAIVSDLDVGEKIVTKVTSEFGPYRVLGVCNPEVAYKYLRKNLEYGVFLPCSVAVYEKKGSVFVSFGMPDKVLSPIIKDESLEKLSEELTGILKGVVDKL